MTVIDDGPRHGRLARLFGRVDGFHSVASIDTVTSVDMCDAPRARRTDEEKVVSEIAIKAVPRSDFGKGAARRLRRSGFIPGVIYGSGATLKHIGLPEHELNLALRKPRVVLIVDLEGTSVLTKPRDVQRDPVRRSLEHIDLVIISQGEADDRSTMAAAIQAAEDAATLAGIDPAAAAAAVEDAVAAGEDPTAAADHALADVRQHAADYADANAREDAAEASEGGAEATSS
jgi:ribosomal protein bL25 (Ctc-form)